MKSMKSLGLLAAASLFAIAGSAFTAAAQAPTRLIYGVVPPADGESQNPNRDIAANDEYQLKPMYENLIGVDPETSEWVPMLAESWEMNEDGTALTFHLRKGVRFHGDFGEMTAEDVKFSLDDATYPEGARPTRAASCGRASRRSRSSIPTRSSSTSTKPA